MRVLKGEELTTMYPILFEKVFGIRPDGHVPRTVIVDDKCEGFVSGYRIDTTTFYISWVGHIRGMLGVRRAFKEIEEYMVKIGVKYYVGRVHQFNTVTQRLMLGMGWYPRGAITAADGMYIEYYKELKDGIIRSN